MFLFNFISLRQIHVESVTHSIIPLISYSSISSFSLIFSLKKLRKAAERPIQPVKAFIAPKPLSPIKKIESAVLQTTAATRHRRESSDIREMQKKDIDVVVTSKPLRKRMSFKRTISKRRPFSTPMAKVSFQTLFFL